jgi:hypothetical protein
MHRVALLVALWLVPAPTGAQDWPQFQQNGQRNGRLAAGPVGPFRARWMWLGPNDVRRNKDSQPGWSDDLTGRDGSSCPLPRSVPMKTRLGGPAVGGIAADETGWYGPSSRTGEGSGPTCV